MIGERNSLPTFILLITFCRPEWFEIEPVPVMMDSTGECIYNGEEWGCLNDGIDHAIHWIWREMLLEELASGKDIAFMVTDITSLGIHVDILKLLGTWFNCILVHTTRLIG